MTVTKKSIHLNGSFYQGQQKNSTSDRIFKNEVTFLNEFPQLAKLSYANGMKNFIYSVVNNFLQQNLSPYLEGYGQDGDLQKNYENDPEIYSFDRGHLKPLMFNGKNFQDILEEFKFFVKLEKFINSEISDFSKKTFDEAVDFIEQSNN